MPIRGWADFLRDKEAGRRSYKQRLALSTEKLEKIKSHFTTKRIKYPQYKEAFDYVHEIYPFANVRQAIVYHASKFVLDDVGYRGMGGFYDIGNRIVVITDCIQANDLKWASASSTGSVYTLDEVLCHELIHYAANFKDPISTTHLEEQIAYGHSVGYLLKKGRTEDFIIEKNMMPYLLGTVDRVVICHRVLTRHYDGKKLAECSEQGLNRLINLHGEELMSEMKKDATALGRQIIQQYGGTVAQDIPLKKRARNLIIDDEF